MMRFAVFCAAALLAVSAQAAEVPPHGTPVAPAAKHKASKHKPHKHKAHSYREESRNKEHEECDRAMPAGAAGEYKEAMHRMHKRMDIDYTGDPDIDFALGMIPHHQGAVDMAETLKVYSVSDDLRYLAASIAMQQPVEIGQMRRFLLSRGYITAKDYEECCAEASRHARPVTEPEQQAVAEYKAAAEKMHRDMAMDMTGNVDLDFINGMIPHHQGAIDMAWVELRHGRNPEMIALARAIITAQQSEIAYMQKRLNEM